MKSSFRWYGDSDPVTLDKIRQIPGMRSIVSAVYDVKPGEVWPEESIKHLVDECREHGLIFDVVESIPVTEEIKLGRPGRDRHIENYCEDELEFRNGLPVSTKGDDNYHGFGMKSIQYVVEKYGGNLVANLEEKIFSVDIIFPVLD